MTACRVLVLHKPEAELVGILGLIALGVNVAAAVILLPHRHGDANMKAVWLFSRNDALGNLAVVIAAGLVAWTQMPWPNLVVAVIIAGLFLQSSYAIIRDARGDLRTARQTKYSEFQFVTMPEVSVIGLATAFAAGAISLLSPCVLPLVPGYVSFVAGRTFNDGESAKPLRTLWLSLCFVLGFTTIFVILGAGANALNMLLARHIGIR
jgi:hypothetical protein